MATYSLHYNQNGCPKCGSEDGRTHVVNFPAVDDDTARKIAKGRIKEIGDKGTNFRLYCKVDLF